MKFVNAAKVSEIPSGTMKHVEARGNEICIANINGRFYAMGDRCGHENARLSLGPLEGTVVTCPMHYSTFDVTTGKLLSGPKLETGGAAKMFEGCPDHVRNEMTKMFRRLAENQSTIKTYDQPIYQVKVDGDNVLVRI